MLYLRHVFKFGSWISKALITVKCVCGYLAMVKYPLGSKNKD